MATVSVEQLVCAIHQTPTPILLALSGGGSGALASLLQTPGASRTVVEAVVPYGEPAMVAWLGGRPDQFCSERTARAMAMVAFRRALGYGLPQVDVAGVACTASLASDRPKQGPHRAHLALQTATRSAFWSLELNKAARTRQQEEQLVDTLLLNLVAEVSGLPDRLEVTLLPGEELAAKATAAAAPWQELLLAREDMICHGRQLQRPRGDSTRAIFPGEFNPLHLGHRRMAQIGAEVLGVPAEFEISITNVDKPPLDYWEIDRRASQFAPEQTLWLTRAARFTEKARLFPGATFLVGIDTLRRIAAPRYYGNDPTACEAAIATIASRGCRFLVFGRNLGTGFVCLRDLDLPEPLRSLCREVPAEQFREDISSTSLRRAGKW